MHVFRWRSTQGIILYQLYKLLPMVQLSLGQIHRAVNECTFPCMHACMQTAMFTHSHKGALVNMHANTYVHTDTHGHTSDICRHSCPQLPMHAAHVHTQSPMSTAVRACSTCSYADIHIHSRPRIYTLRHMFSNAHPCSHPCSCVHMYMQAPVQMHTCQQTPTFTDAYTCTPCPTLDIEEGRVNLRNLSSAASAQKSK